MVGGGMRANTETSRSSARAGAATTMSILKMAKVFGFYCEYCKNRYLQLIEIDN